MSGIFSVPHMVEVNSRPHFVYVMWEGDTALYVGMTCNYDRRLRQWQVMSPEAPNYTRGGWPSRVTHVDVWEVGDRADALSVEAQTIWGLKPLHNSRIPQAS